MHSKRSGAIALAFLALAAYMILAVPARDEEWQPADTCVPKPSSVVPEDSRPVLVSSAPLPRARKAAKPAIAADCCETVVVVAQYVKMGSVGMPVWRSPDGGASWGPVRQLPGWPTHTDFFADPWLVTDGRGRYYCVQLSATTAPGGRGLSGNPSWPVRRSSDGGEHWSESSIVDEGVDRPVLGVSANGRWLVAAASTSQRDPSGVRYCVGVFVSRDHGNRWTGLSSPVQNCHAIPFSVVVDDAGRIAVACVAEGGGSRSAVYSTLDLGWHWAEKELVPKLQPDRIHPFNGERFPVVAIDGQKHLHVAFVGSRAKRLYASSSADWINWLDPRLLSDDDAEEIRMPAIASLGSMVHVLWMERRGTRWQTYYRGSRDMGSSWSEKVLLSVPHMNSGLVKADGFILLGDDDQACITDDGTATAHAVWAIGGANASDASNLWHAVVRWKTRNE